MLYSRTLSLSPQLKEKQLAGLILRYIAKEIKPEESRRLEEHINRAAANRLKFEELINKNRLREKLRAFYDQKEKDE